jgi:hypothetical protein
VNIQVMAEPTVGLLNFRLSATGGVKMADIIIREKPESFFGNSIEPQ